MLFMNDHDTRLLAEMIGAGVLTKICPDKLPFSDGTTLIACSDCDQSDEYMAHLREMCNRAGKKPRFHRDFCNGGAIMAAPDSGLADEFCPNPALYHLGQITGARALKGLRSHTLLAHTPCGMAYAHALDLARVIYWQCRAREHLGTQFPDDQFVKVLHANLTTPEQHARGEQICRTYVVNRKAFYLWAKHGL